MSQVLIEPTTEPDTEPAAQPQTGWKRQVTRVGKIVAGAVLVLAGLAMVVLPGPAVVVLPAGLALLATEIPWLRVRLARGYDRLPGKVKAKTPQRLVRILHPAD